MKYYALLLALLFFLNFFFCDKNEKEIDKRDPIFGYFINNKNKKEKKKQGKSLEVLGILFDNNINRNLNPVTFYKSIHNIPLIIYTVFNIYMYNMDFVDHFMLIIIGGIGILS